MFHFINEYRALRLFRRLFTEGLVCSLGINTEEVKKMNLRYGPDDSGDDTVIILDGKMVDDVLDHFQRRGYRKSDPYYQLYALLKNSLLYKGKGSVAPCFDVYDRCVEFSRGHWYAVPYNRWSEMKSSFQEISKIRNQ